MTSNIGSHIIQENYEKLTADNGEETEAKTKVQLMDLLRKTIRPEFLNRIDDIIMFEPLTRDNLEEIVQLQFKQIQKQLAENDIKLDGTLEALNWLAELGYDPTLGARPLKRVLQKRLMNELSKQILSGTVKKDSHIMMSLDESKNLVFKEV